jgi:hypothetical protein
METGYEDFPPPEAFNFENDVAPKGPPYLI